MVTPVTGILFVIIGLSNFSLAQRYEERLVKTNLGMVRPKHELFRPRNFKYEDVVFTYLGIPYAAPPVGDRRFRVPEPVESWKGILNATALPQSCPQIREPGFNFSEDCLYLNVYVSSSLPKNAPVMMFIHGGGLEVGSGSENSGVALTALGDVIVVTINYRLNIFGFFTTGDDVIPPNLGLLDQRKALQWVYENIKAFGGDPEQITIFGESAGAASVGWHILSEGSRTYFRHAILQSGVPLNPWGTLNTQDNIQQWVELIGDLALCGASDVAECLRNRTEEELLFIFETTKQLYPTTLIFVPFLDGNFFTSNISTLLKDGGYSDIDILLGTNRDEGTVFTFTITGNPIERPFVPKSQFSLIAQTTGNPLLTGLYETVYSDYIDDNNNYEGALSALLGDYLFTCGVNDFARKVAEGGSKVYTYRMTHQPLRSVTFIDWLGVTHTEDLQFVFGLPFLYPDFFGESLLDVKFSFYIIQMWANFAKSGDPNTPYRLPRGVPEWPRFSAKTEIYKELDLKLSNAQRLRQQQCNFLDNLVPQITDLTAAAAEGSQDSSG